MSEVSVPFCATSFSLACGRRPNVLRDEVLQRRGQTQALDALRSPLGGDLIARRAPHLFRVALEEGEVELASEAVDEEVFEALLFLDRAHTRRRVADADPRPSAPGPRFLMVLPLSLMG